MTVAEIVLIANSPLLAGIFVWIIKVEIRLTEIQTTCRLKTGSGECPKGEEKSFVT
jgi:hypothetical protein